MSTEGRNAEELDLYEAWRTSDEGRRAGHFIAGDGISSWSTGKAERAAFEAGAASRQAEIDRLREAVQYAAKPTWLPDIATMVWNIRQVARRALGDEA